MQVQEQEHPETVGKSREENDSESEGVLHHGPELKKEEHHTEVEVLSLGSSKGQEELTRVTSSNALPKEGGALGSGSSSAISRSPQTEKPLSEGEQTHTTAKGTDSSKDVDSMKRSPQAESANATDNRNVNDANSAQESEKTENVVSEVDKLQEGNGRTSVATDTPVRTTQSIGVNDAPATTESEDNDTSAATANTKNTYTELPNTTVNSPLPSPEPQISSNVASSLQNKPNVDSSVSPLWMHTAAPLLIVAALFSVTVY
ncbi:uncharacterized protein TM35_000471490 [Trypanosoma theileri]|uniref:Uncharacterized protein n=1 Tax=Trypanosoma theileri TaxID=67003 RepID=A0A1X0NHL6_9TRYP|nr:uncharacterized protein TM35_000471490 [Trypanosoma theileri]ORC84254.1 hypothetical protein TM35_000471490 [Trypanosoma theileri]